MSHVNRLVVSLENVEVLFSLFSLSVLVVTA